MSSSTPQAAGKKKSWRERLGAYSGPPEVKPIPERMRARQAAEEERQAGGGAFTPYWRTLKVNGALNLKYPGGLDNLMHRLESEGHTVVQRGKRYFVEDFEQKLV